MFFSNYLSGLKIGKECQPRLVISGNDNGFSRIKAKSAGADIVLIQNGIRPPVGDSAFSYADHYFSMAAKKITDLRMGTGCIFKNVYFFGSLRLYNFLRSGQGVSRNGQILYDFLFVQAFEIPYAPDEKFYGNFYSTNNEIKLIKEVNKLASCGELKIAFQFRGKSTLEELKKLGLFSERITYIINKQQSVYASVLASDVVMSPISTLSLEAMALNKKVFFVNLSGNPEIFQDYKDLGVEYKKPEGFDASGDKTYLGDCINEVRKQSKDYKPYIFQNPEYVRDFAAVIDIILA